MFENVCLLHLLHHKDSKHERNIPMYVARVQSAVLFSHATILPQSPKPDRRSVATKVVTIDVRESAGGKEFGNRVDSRAATAAAATDSVTDTCREWAAPKGSPEDCCVCDEISAAPMVHLGSSPRRLHLPCYATHRVRASATLRCPACRATVTVEQADGRALRQHNEEVMADAMAGRATSDAGWERRGGTDHGHTGRQGRVSDRQQFPRIGGGGRRLDVPRSCDVHRRCALGWGEEAIPQPESTRHAHSGHIPESVPTCGAPRGGPATPVFNRCMASADRQTQHRREL